jgi:3-dehydrosphinganine reductase
MVAWVITNMNNQRSGTFKDEIVLITGGSMGIGAALANIFAKEGAHVWLLARREEYLEKSLRNVINSSIRPDQNHGYVSCDVSDEAGVDLAIDHVIRETGVPNIVINCAGVVHPGEFLDIDDNKFNWMMDINFFGTVHLIRKVLPKMIARGSGYIVNISSMAAVFGLYGYTAYAASKSAVLSFTEALRLEVKPKGIDISVVLPTDTATPQLEYELKYRSPELITLTKLGIVHSPESVAEEIMKGIARKKFLILPGIDAKFFYWAVKILGNGLFPIFDWMIRRTQSKIV